MDTKDTERPALAIYHANAKGTGCAARFAVIPAAIGVDGALAVTLAPQLTVGNLHNGVFPRFDWEGAAIKARLGFDDVCKVLEVLRGVVESIEDGKGLYHRSPAAALRIVFRHMIEPRPGYMLEFYRRDMATDAESVARIYMGPGEALGLCSAIEGAMAAIAFGV